MFINPWSLDTLINFVNDMSKSSIRDWVFVTFPLCLVLGSFTIAIIDPNYRQPFMDLSMDLSKVFLGEIVIRRMIPAEKVGLRRRIH